MYYMLISILNHQMCAEILKIDHEKKILKTKKILKINV